MTAPWIGSPNGLITTGHMLNLSPRPAQWLGMGYFSTVGTSLVLRLSANNLGHSARQHLAPKVRRRRPQGSAQSIVRDRSAVDLRGAAFKACGV